jgi:DeoR family fructose operon transcriptional repressor
MPTVQGTIASEQRHTWLRGRLAADGSVGIAEAAAALGVSEMTIRRDLLELEERGVARRVRGGASAVGPEPFATRSHTAVRAKSRIAAKLAPLVPATGAVSFDASSTIMRMAASIGHARDLTILTNGPDTFDALQERQGTAALLTGGSRDERTGSLVGPLACLTASQLSVDTFFASAASIDPDSGAQEATLAEAEVKRALAARAERVVLAVDATKLQTRAMALALQWDRIDLLVTELDPDDARLLPFRDLVEVM